MSRLPNILCVTLASVMLATGCESETSPETTQDDAVSASSRHPAGEAAERFLRALQYSDTGTAVETHVESTHEGFYCQSEEFRRVFSTAKERAGDEACREVRALGNAGLATLDDRARLAAQMLRVVCEDPQATCADYSRRVLEAQRDNWDDWTQTMQRFEIRRVLGDAEEAVVYVDLFTQPRGRPEHRTLRMERIDGEWYVGDDLLASEETSGSSGDDSPAEREPSSSYDVDFD